MSDLTENPRWWPNNYPILVDFWMKRFQQKNNNLKKIKAFKIWNFTYFWSKYTQKTFFLGFCSDQNEKKKPDEKFPFFDPKPKKTVFRGYFDEK